MHITFPPAGQSRREENKQPKGEYTMETLRIGLVGTGGIGRTHIERINNTLQGGKVVACADPAGAFGL